MPQIDSEIVKPVGAETKLAFSERVPELPLEDLCRIAELYRDIATDWIAVAKAKHGGPATGNLISDLRAYLRTLWMAERYSPEPQRKRPPSQSREWLVNSLAQLLARNGIAPEAREGGPLAQAMKICFDHAGEHVSRIPIIIGTHLKPTAI